MYDRVEGALTLGTGRLAVDGVLLVAEHGDYPKSKTGQTVYPKRRLFSQVLDVFDRSGRVVPVFIDKHLADNWADAKWAYDEARRRKVPMMAGSSLPGLWRYPPADVRRGSRLAQIVVTSYHTLDGYGFHAVEVPAMPGRAEGRRRDRGSLGAMHQGPGRLAGRHRGRLRPGPARRGALEAEGTAVAEGQADRGPRPRPRAVRRGLQRRPARLRLHAQWCD